MLPEGSEDFPDGDGQASGEGSGYGDGGDGDDGGLGGLVGGVPAELFWKERSERLEQEKRASVYCKSLTELSLLFLPQVHGGGSTDG